MENLIEAIAEAIGSTAAEVAALLVEAMQEGF